MRVFNLAEELEKERKKNKELEERINKTIKHLEETIEFEKQCGFNYWEYDGGCDEYIEKVNKTLDILKGGDNNESK